MSYSNVPGDSRCECHDAVCHESEGRCTGRATCVLFRVDMEDLTGTAFCDPCAEDALDSGLFTTADEGGPPYDAATATGMYDREDG